MSGKPASLQSLLKGHASVAIDSNVLIYLLEGSGDRAERAATIVDAVARGEVEGVMSSLAIAEVLVPAARRNDTIGFEQTAAIIRDLGFRIIALDAPLAEDVAWIRGRRGTSLHDAMNVATVRAGGATVFITNDRRIPTLPHLDVVILDDLVA